MTIFRQNQIKTEEVISFQSFDPQKWPLGLNCFENNFKHMKALLKNILHVKGNEAILDFKGTLKEK